MSEELKPCPFCGGADIEVRENRLSPKMDGSPGALISVDIYHWCDGVDLKPGQYVNISVHSREMDDALEMWNSRPFPPDCEQRC